jgi:hypothetical protein
MPAAILAARSILLGLEVSKARASGMAAGPELQRIDFKRIYRLDQQAGRQK